MRNRKLTFLVIILLIIFSTPIWMVEFLPLSDYPSHLLSVDIIREYDNPQFNFKDYFVINWKPIPNLTADVFILLLSHLVPIQIAGKIYLNLFGILFVLSIFYLLGAVDPRKIFLGFFGFLFFYNWYFNNGYLNFYGSLSIFFFTLGFWIKSFEQKSLRDTLIFALLTVILFFSHLFTYSALILCLIILSFFELKNTAKIKRTILALVPSLLLFLNYLFIMKAGSSANRGVDFSSPQDSIIHFILYTLVSFSKKDILFYLVPLLIMGYLLIRNLWSNGKNEIERRLFWLFLCLIVVFFILPYQAAAVWPFNVRLNLFILFIGLASISSSSIEKVKKLILPSAVVFSVAILIYTFSVYHRLSNRIGTYTSGIEYVQPNRNILPLSIDVYGGCATITPFSTTWAYYHIAKGGAGPYLFHLPHGQIVNYKRPVKETFPAPSLYPLRTEEFNMVMHSDPYDYFLIWGDFRNREKELEGEFELLYQNGDLKLFEKKNEHNRTVLPL